MTTRVDIEIKRGTRWKRPFTIRDEDGALVDITGWVFWFTLKQPEDILDADDTDSILQVTSDSGHFTILDAVNGRGQLELLEADTADLETAHLYYDIKAQDTAGAFWVPFEGRCSLTHNTTRSQTQ